MYRAKSSGCIRASGGRVSIGRASVVITSVGSASAVVAQAAVV